MSIDLDIGIPRIEITSRQLASDQTLVRIASGSALFFVGTFLGLGLNYVYAIVLARLLGPEQFGLYALGLGCFNLLSVIALAGLDTAVLRFVPALRAQNDAAGIGGIIRAALVLSSGLGVLFATVLLLSSDMLANQFLHHPDATTVLQLFALSIPLFVVSTVAITALQAFGEVRWRTSVKYLCEPVVRFAVTLALIWAGWGLISALVALPVALAITAVLALLPFRQLLSNGNKSIFSGMVNGNVLKYSLPLFGGLVLNGLATRSDVLFLGHWIPVEQVGIYSAAFQTSAIMAVVLGTLESIATPFLSESISKNDKGRIRSLACTVVRWTVTGTLPLIIVMVVFAKDIMALFGNDFESGWVCLVILAIGQFANSAMGCSNGMLLWAGQSKLVMWNSVFASAVQIGLYFVLIPTYGAIGAALAASAGIVLVVILRVVQVHQILNVWPYDSTLCKPLISGLIALVVVMIAKSLFAFLHTGVFVGLFCVSYAAFLFTLGIDASDKAILLHLKQRLTQFV